MADDDTKVLKDYAASDPRSVQAWLHGKDDGRNKRFGDFAKKNGTSVGEDVHFSYAQKVRAEDKFDPKQLQSDLDAMDSNAKSSGLLVNLLVPVIGLSMGVMLFMALNPS